MQRSHTLTKYTTVIAALQRGDAVVMPTDTVFGICACAANTDAVRRLYRVRGRNPKKPCIILIAHMKDVARFGVRVTLAQQRLMRRVWPGPVSIVLDAPKKQWTYLHRGTRTLAFRVPKNNALRALLRRTGPLIAPSANPEGKSVATSVRMAKKYFGSAVAVYVAGRARSRVPSGIIDLTKQEPRLLRAHATLKDFQRHINTNTISKWTKTSTRAR